MPRTVKRYCGLLGLGSSFSRRWRIDVYKRQLMVCSRASSAPHRFSKEPRWANLPLVITGYPSTTALGRASVPVIPCLLYTSIGAVVDIKGRKTHKTIDDALQIVEHLEDVYKRQIILYHIPLLFTTFFLI